MHSICICMITKVYEDEGWDKTRPVWFMSAADPVSAHLWAAHRSVTTAEKAPAVKPLPMWHRRARPEPRIQDSLASGELTWDDWQLFGSQMNPPDRLKVLLKCKADILAAPWLIIRVIPVSGIKGQTSPGSRITDPTWAEWSESDYSHITAAQAEHIITKTAALYLPLELKSLALKLKPAEKPSWSRSKVLTRGRWSWKVVIRFTAAKRKHRTDLANVSRAKQRAPLFGRGC